MKYDFTTKVDRTGTSAMKNDKALVKALFDLEYYEDTIPMWIADMDFKCAPEITDSLKIRAEQEIYGYTSLSKDYFEALINWYRSRYNIQINRKWISYSPGTISAVKNVIRAFTNKNDGVIIQPPVYYPFANEIAHNNRTQISNFLIKDENNNYTIDFEDFELKCKEPNTKLFIYCNPHNPTGNIWPPEFTERLLEICIANDVLMFSDEVHSDLIRKDRSFTSAIAMNTSENLIVATAANKTFNLAGLEITNLIIKNPEIKAKLDSYTGLLFINTFSHEAAIAAYSKGASWVDELRTVLDANLSLMHNYFKENMPKVKFNIPAGTYLTWIDFTGYGIDEAELIRKFASEAHLILEGGSIFGDVGKGFVRINIACPPEVLQDALNRMAAVLEI